MDSRKVRKWLCCLAMAGFAGTAFSITAEASTNVQIPSEATLMSINDNGSWAVVEENDGLCFYFINSEGTGSGECNVNISYADASLNGGNNCLLQLTWDFSQVKGGWYQDISGASAFTEVEDGQRWTRVFVPGNYFTDDSCTMSCGQSTVTIENIPGNSGTQEPEVTATPVPEATATPVPEVTATPTPEATSTPTPEITATPVPKETATPVPKETATPVPKETATPVPEATATPVPKATATPTPEATATPVPEATATPVPEATATPVPEATATPVPEATATPAPVMPIQDDLFGGGVVSGNIVLDGELKDWEDVSAIYMGTDNQEYWKAAASPDKSVLYLCMSGKTVSEWDYNFQWKVLSFTAGEQVSSYQFASLSGNLPGAEAVIVNTANGNVPGDYVVECSIPVSALPNTNFLISLDNTNIWAADVPVTDGIMKEPENTPIPVYNGINIDGSFSDWDAVAKTAGSCPNAEHPECLRDVAMVFDGDYVYIYLESGDSSNAFWGGSHSNAKFAITTDLGYTMLFTMNSDDTISGVDGAISKHYGDKAEIAIPKSALPEYMKSISFGYYQQEPMIRDVVNLVAEEEKGSFGGVVYDGLYGDWKYYPHQLIQYATAGTQENVVDGEGALYADGSTLFGHVKVVMNAHMNEWATLFTQAVTFKFGESDSLVLYPRFVTVDAGGNINWNPQVDNLANGTYEYYISSLDAWGTSTNISDLNDADRIFGKMMVTITDTSRECEFYLDLVEVAEKLGCSPEEFKVIKAQFGRIGQEWLITAGASSGAWLGILFCVATVAIVLGARKIRKGTIR